jgi:hypothetical protein
MMGMQLRELCQISPERSSSLPITFEKESPMSFIQEFKEFAMKGNVVDLAVGVIIGGAFQKIVDSLVKDC